MGMPLNVQEIEAALSFSTYRCRAGSPRRHQTSEAHPAEARISAHRPPMDLRATCRPGGDGYLTKSFFQLASAIRRFPPSKYLARLAQELRHLAHAGGTAHKALSIAIRGFSSARCGQGRGPIAVQLTSAENPCYVPFQNLGRQSEGPPKSSSAIIHGW